MFIFMLWIGVSLWLGGTILVRLVGDEFLPGQQPSAWIMLYVLSAAAMAGTFRALCAWLGIPPGERAHAAVTLILPTLMLDPFSTLFFARVFPNLDPAAAGAFGGWMLVCCAGAVLGVWVRR